MDKKKFEIVEPLFEETLDFSELTALKGGLAGPPIGIAVGGGCCAGVGKAIGGTCCEPTDS